MFIRVIALSNPISRIKSLFVPHLKTIIFDEYICNTKLGEKYLPNEAFKFKEMYNTFQREAADEGIKLKAYFLGNPYSTYNPYFAWWNVPYSKIRPGCILSGDNWIVQAYQIKEELKAKILERNPLYKFNDEYTDYAFGGMAINDKNIRVLEKVPEKFRLNFFIKIEDSYIKIFRNFSDDESIDFRYWAGKAKESEIFKNESYCFDINDLANNNVMWTNESRLKFDLFKMSIGSRLITYQDIEVAYLIQSLYGRL